MSSPSPSTPPPGTLTTSLPARFRMKTTDGKYITNNVYSSTSVYRLSLDQTKPVANFSIVTSGVFNLPANFVGLKNSDATSSPFYKYSTYGYVLGGGFWSSTSGGGQSLYWQFYRQTDGTYILVNYYSGVYNYLRSPGTVGSTEPQLTTYYGSGSTVLKFYIEDAATPLSSSATTPAGSPVTISTGSSATTPAGSPVTTPAGSSARTPAGSPITTPAGSSARTPAGSPATKSPSTDETGIKWWVWLIVAIVVVLLLGGGYYMYMKSRASTTSS